MRDWLRHNIADFCDAHWHNRVSLHGSCLLVAFCAIGSSQVKAQTVEMIPQDSVKSEEPLQAWRTTLDFGRTWLRDRPLDEFLDCEFVDLPEAARESVDSLLGWVLRKEVHPHKRVHPIEIASGVDLSVRVATATQPNEDDLVEYRWTCMERPLRIVVSANALQIDFALDQIPACNGSRGGPCVVGTRRWVEEIIKLEGEYDIMDSHIEYRVNLPWPRELADDIWFSSAPDQNILRLRGMPYWHDRVDAFVENGTLSILIYKKVGKLMGYQDGSKWFGDEFRALVQSKMQAQRKLTPPVPRSKE